MNDDIKGCTHCGTSYQFPEGINGWWECPNCGAKNGANSVVKESSTTDTIAVPRELVKAVIASLRYLWMSQACTTLGLQQQIDSEITQLEALLK